MDFLLISSPDEKKPERFWLSFSDQSILIKNYSNRDTLKKYTFDKVREQRGYYPQSIWIHAQEPSAVLEASSYSSSFSASFIYLNNRKYIIVNPSDPTRHPNLKGTH